MRQRRISVAVIVLGVALLGVLATVQATSQRDLRRFWRVYAPPPLTAQSPSVGARMALGVMGAQAEQLADLRTVGFSVSRYDMAPFSSNEVAPGQWDWQPMMSALEQAKQQGFYFALSLQHVFPPKWYLEREKPTRIRCVEHREEIPALSPWEPKVASWLDRQWSALARQIRTSGRSVDVLILSIHGEYGDANLFTGHTVPADEWTRQVGAVRPHKGFWCDDDRARQHFRRAMLRKYGDLATLNRTWGTQFASEEEIRYPQSPAQGRRWWLDFVTWYQNGVTYLTDVACRLSQRYFPNSVRLVPISIPDEDMRYGADISALVKVAARHRAGVRSTHAGSLPLAQGGSLLLARIASACRFYGAPLWLEAALQPPTHQSELLFHAMAHGAAGLFDWAQNIRQQEGVYLLHSRALTVSQPVADVAMFYPTTAMRLADVGEAPTMREGCARARDFFPFDIVDERMIRDGALNRYRLLVFWEGTVVEQDVLDTIVEWVQRGGVVVAYDFGKVTNVEGDGTAWRTLFGYAGRLKAWRGSIQGEIPAGGYTLPIDESHQAGFLRGEWSAPEREGNRLWRSIGNLAQVDLLLKAQQAYSLTVRAWLPAESSVRYEVRLGQHRLGYLDSPGETVYKFVIPAAWVANEGVHPLIFRAAGGQAARCRIAEIQVSALDSAVPPLPGIPPVRYLYQLDPQLLNREWTQRLGKGMCVFVPVRRVQDGLSAYLQVLRRLVYRLSELDASASNAPLIDDAADGVVTALLTDRILFYNTTTRTVNRELPPSSELFARYTQPVNLPAGASRLQIPPQSLVVLPFGDAPVEFILQCEGFTDLRGQQRRAVANCSPGEGQTCVWLPPGKSIRTRFPIEAGGKYRLFVRCLVGERLVAPLLFVNQRSVRLEKTPPVSGTDVLRSEPVVLNKGANTLEIQAPPDAGCLADFVILTNELDVASYRFARK